MPDLPVVACRSGRHGAAHEYSQLPCFKSSCRQRNSLSRLKKVASTCEKTLISEQLAYMFNLSVLPELDNGCKGKPSCWTAHFGTCAAALMELRSMQSRNLRQYLDKQSRCAAAACLHGRSAAAALLQCPRMLFCFPKTSAQRSCCQFQHAAWYHTHSVAN